MATKRFPPIPPYVRLVRDHTAHREYFQTRPETQITDSSDAARLLAFLADEEQEVFVVLCLNARSRVMAIGEVSRGLIDSSLVHPREVFRLAIANGAAGIILAHNHPSGDPTPSAEDRQVTRQLVNAGVLLNIPVYDHVIIAGDRHVSFASAGLL